MSESHSYWDHLLIVAPDTDQDIEKLVERTEKEGDNKDEEKKEGLGFAFAQIWSAEKDTLEEVQDENSAPNEQDDSWTQTLAVSFPFAH